jgi:hypothetical protein
MSDSAPDPARPDRELKPSTGHLGRNAAARLSTVPTDPAVGAGAQPAPGPPVRMNGARPTSSRNKMAISGHLSRMSHTVSVWTASLLCWRPASDPIRPTLFCNERPRWRPAQAPRRGAEFTRRQQLRRDRARCERRGPEQHGVGRR